MLKIALVIFSIVLLGCQKEEIKPYVAPPEESADTLQKTSTAYKNDQAEKLAVPNLPPMARPLPTSPQPLAQYLSDRSVTQTSATQDYASDASGFQTFYIYSDSNSRTNHFIPSGWMGDYADLTISDDYRYNAFSGSTCIRIIYSNAASGGARWAGIYWQQPSGNWGSNASGGFDLTGAKKLTFMARGEKGGERIQEFKIGGISGAYPDSDKASIGPIILTKEWVQYSIDLNGKNLTNIIGGFAWATNLDTNPGGCTFYLDEIRYE